MDFEKKFEYLEEKLNKIKFDDPQSDYAKGFNTGAQTMFYYGRIALMDLQNECVSNKVREKVSA